MKSALLIPYRRGLFAALLLMLAVLAVAPASGQAAGRTETLRFFNETVSMKLTRADGTVVSSQPFPDVAPGDVLEINSLLYRGDHRRHAKRSSGSVYLRCAFTSAPEPDCLSYSAIGGSLLVMSGSPGTVVNGTGRYEGASGRVTSSKDVEGGQDVVARIKLADRARR